MKKILKITGIMAIAILAITVTTIKNIESTESGTLITFRDNTGYYIEKSDKNKIKNVQSTPTGTLTTYEDGTGYYEENENKNLKIVNQYTKENGDLVIDFSNGSWAIINDKTKKYIFQPIELGDWDYTFSTKQELKNCMEMYTRADLNEI